MITGNAAVFGLKTTLDLKGLEFNNLVTLFYVTYIVFDIPWVVSIKKFGANRVLGVALIGWSASTLGMGFVKNYHQALACRLLLGLFEAGLLPCMIFVISTIWNQKQQAKRIAVIYCATTVSGAFGGLFAYGVQSMGTRAGLEPWRWLFIIEGILSFAVGGMCWLSMPYSAERAWFLNKEQSEFMVRKKARDTLYKGEDTFKPKHVWAAVTDPLVYLVAFSLFSSSLPLLGFGTFLPTIIKGLGYVTCVPSPEEAANLPVMLDTRPCKPITLLSRCTRWPQEQWPLWRGSRITCTNAPYACSLCQSRC